MVKCTFCGSDIERGTGKMFVKTDGKIFNFCSNKCEKNIFKLKRKPLETKWSKLHKKGGVRKEQND
jgi:large subunit ribosomal protein L24e